MGYKIPDTAADDRGFTGRDLRHWRESAELSRRELAERAGCSQSTVKNLERGELPRRSFVLPAILAVLEAALGREGAA